MKIAGYLKTSLLDWPGEVSSVMWTQGCNFACPFCHNRDLITLKRKDVVGEEEVIKSLKQRKKWITHLVITGGEPMLQTDLVEFCQKIKAMGFKIKLDTNGSKPKVVRKLISLNLVDFWAMDIKTDFKNYQLAVNSGKKNLELVKDIQKSMKLIVKSGKDFEFRTTVVPGMHDVEIMKKMGEEIKKIMGSPARSFAAMAGRWTWQKFVGRNCVDPKFDKMEGISKREIERWRKGVGVKIDLRGWV